jgi:ferredoxin-NADP reductase
MTTSIDAAAAAAPSTFATTRLLVQQVRYEAEDVVSLTLVDPSGAGLEPWSPGAHLTIVLPSGLTRQYSLCGRPEDTDSYTVAVLREANGRGGSREIHDTGLVGRTLAVRGPRNHFKLVDADSYILVAGGIGITPLLAMARELETRGAAWRMAYGGRNRASMAFRDDLAVFGDKVAFAAQDEVGLLDLDSIVRQATSGCAIYACGPGAMLTALESTCREHGVALHIERFAAEESTTAAAAGPAGTTTAFEIDLQRTGVTRIVPSDRSILDVVREVIPDMPSSCEEGFCGSCETRVLEGIPEHHDSILDEDERAANNTMMICVGRSHSKRLVLDL